LLFGEQGGEERETALVCERGHQVTRSLENLPSPPSYCERCGAPTISQCKNCGGRILGDWPSVMDISSSPPPSHCPNCGKPYPWREEALARANKVARMQAETYALDEKTTSELVAFAELVATNQATKEEASTFGLWFKKKAGKEAAIAVGGILKDVATSVVSDIIRKTMIGS
jgi:hypothetical protein